MFTVSLIQSLPLRVCYVCVCVLSQVLLFPGGAREVVKRRGQEYQLLWKDTPDFVRLASKCGALIVPFAAVGADDAYDVVMEVWKCGHLGCVGAVLFYFNRMT